MPAEVPAVMAAVRMAPVAAVVAARGGLATLETQAAPFSCRRMALRACLFIVRADVGRVAGGGTVALVAATSS